MEFPQKRETGGGGVSIGCRFKRDDSNFFSGLAKMMASYGVSTERRTGEGGIWVGCRFKLADFNFFQAWRKRWLVMEFPQKEEQEEEEFG
jgi:hypothetical protein